MKLISNKHDAIRKESHLTRDYNYPSSVCVKFTGTKEQIPAKFRSGIIQRLKPRCLQRACPANIIHHCQPNTIDELKVVPPDAL